MSHRHPKVALQALYLVAVCLIGVAPGCGDGVDRAPEQDVPDDAISEWRALMTNPAQNLDDPNLKQAANRIGRIAPHFVDEMIAEFGDPELTSEKLLALVASLEEVVSPEKVPQLIEFTQSGNAGAVRRSAAHLLGLLGSEDAREALMELKEDESETVRFTALLALARQGEPSVRESLREFFRRDNVQVSTRERVVSVLCEVPTDADRTMLERAIQTDGYEQETYLKAVAAMGRVGTKESMNAINVLKANPKCSPAVRQMCDNSIAAIEERSKPGTAGSQ